MADILYKITDIETGEYHHFSATHLRFVKTAFDFDADKAKISNKLSRALRSGKPTAEYEQALGIKVEIVKE